MTSNTQNLIVAAINGAEDITDPLDGLAERITADPGAPSRPRCWTAFAS